MLWSVQNYGIIKHIFWSSFWKTDSEKNQVMLIGHQFPIKIVMLESQIVWSMSDSFLTNIVWRKISDCQYLCKVISWKNIYFFSIATSWGGSPWPKPFSSGHLYTERVRIAGKIRPFLFGMAYQVIKPYLIMYLICDLFWVIVWLSSLFFILIDLVTVFMTSHKLWISRFMFILANIMNTPECSPVRFVIFSSIPIR